MNDRLALRGVLWAQLCLVLLSPSVLADSLIFEERFENLPAVQANGGTAGTTGWMSFVAGVSGNGADFSGDKRVCYPLAGRFQPSAGTVEFWVKFRRVNGFGLFDIGGLGNANSWGILKNSDHLIFEVKNQSNSFDQAWSPAPLVHDDEWHLITAVWRFEGATTRFKLCVDGRCKSDYDGAVADSHPNVNVSMCVGWSGWYGYSESTLDELRIYDFAKTDAQIQAAYELLGPDTRRPSISLVGSARIGGSKATLYGYFPSKEALFMAIMERLAEQYMSPALERLEESTDDEPRVALQRFGEQFIAFITTPEAIATYRVVMSEAAHSDIGRSFYENGPQRTLEAIARYLSGAMSRKQLRRTDASVAAQHLMALLAHGESWNHYFMRDSPSPTRAQIKRIVERALDAFFDGYGP